MTAKKEKPVAVEKQSGCGCGCIGTTQLSSKAQPEADKPKQ